MPFSRILDTAVGMPAAAAGPTAALLLDLLIILVAAKLGHEVLKRVGQPGIVGEVVAGMVVGPSVLGWVEPSTTLEVFAELGVVFLLFWVGLETRLDDLRQVGPSAVRVGAWGFLLPLMAGVGAAALLGEPVGTSLLMGAALVATSVGITAAVLMELGLIHTPAARTILGAAVVDDVLAMLLLAVVAGLTASGGVDVVGLLITIVLALAFIIFFALGGTRVAARWPTLLEAPRFSESPLLPAVMLCLALSVLAAEVGLAVVIGAFLAGMIVAETKERTPIEQEVAPIYAFFAPFFFAFIGLSVSLAEFRSGDAVLLLLGLSALAALTKFAGAWIGARGLGRRDAVVVAVGMIPRGEVGIVVAGIGRQTGALDDRLFGVVVGMSVLTTLLAPALLRVVARDPPSSGTPPGFAD